MDNTRRAAPHVRACAGRFFLLLLAAASIVGVSTGVRTAAAKPASPATSPLTFYTDKTAFAAAAPTLVTEDFEQGRLIADFNSNICNDPFDSNTADGCWSPGDIVLGLSFGSSNPDGATMSIVGPNYFANQTIAAAVLDTPVDSLEVGFTYGTLAVGMDLLSDSAIESVSIIFYGSGNVVLGSTTAASSGTGTFFGVISSVPIARMELSSNAVLLVDNVELPPTVNADLSIDLSGSESPAGTMKYTIVVTNSGPFDATGVVVTLPLPSVLAYTSDDCGGSHSGAWTWNAGSLANGGQLTCHVTASITGSQEMIATAKVRANELDVVATNNMGSAINKVVAGLDTPATGVSLFRSFYDLEFKDETGASFSLRNNADKVILIQKCAVWCSACFSWSKLAQDLQNAVDQAIGPGHFLDVDMLIDGGSVGAPSSRKSASGWKSATAFPGPVLHSEQSSQSPLFELGKVVLDQFDEVPALSYFPEFYILSPGCANQIAVRATPGNPSLGEQRVVDTSTIDEMAALITQVWQQRPCARPLVERVDRCSVGAAVVYSDLQSPNILEAAEQFTVANGAQYVIGSMTAVTNATALDFSVYADAAGKPGTTVCSSPGLPTSNVFAPGVQKIELDKACKLGPGNYWVGLTGRTGTPGVAPTWQGGYLPPDGPFMYRDPGNGLNAGCTTWSAAGQCLAGQGNTQLCYMLENDSIFHGGFE